MSQIATTRTQTLRFLKTQIPDFHHIRRALERDHYETHGEAKRFRQWEVLAHLYELPEVKELIEKGRHKKTP